jgi:hypothetical protein
MRVNRVVLSACHFATAPFKAAAEPAGEPGLRSIDLAVRRRVLQAEVICVNVDRRGRHLQILGN